MKDRRSVFIIEFGLSRRSGQLRDFEALAILAFYVLVGFLVFKPFRLWIELQGTAKAECNIPKLAMDAREMGIQGGHRQVRRIAGADRIEEPLPLVALFRLGRVGGNGNGVMLARLIFVVKETFVAHIKPFRAEETVCAVAGPALAK